MTPTVTELLAALPQEESISSERITDNGLKDAFEQLALRPVPVGSIGRLWSLGSLQAKIAMAYLLYWVRGAFQNSDSRQQALADTHLKTAVLMQQRWATCAAR